VGGLFGVISKEDCVADLYYGTDYHSHLGTMRGGLAVRNGSGFTRIIHDITNAQFRSKFEDDLGRLTGTMGIGVISDYEDQPLIISSHHGTYAIVTVGKVGNLDALVQAALQKNGTHFSEMTGSQVNPTQLVAHLIDQGDTFVDGIRHAQEAIEGSCSILLLTDEGIYAARDRLGRTPVVTGEKEGAHAVTFETCAFPNLGYRTTRYLGPGEIVRVSAEGVESLLPPGEAMQICAFLWVYYGYPGSDYEGINVEATRYRCGGCLAQRDDTAVDVVAGIPDSGTGHAIGYANAAGVPYSRPFVKYTPTWPRSFMPQDQRVRDLVS
jgi:amidophosphoribosyltransferase